MKKCVTVLTVSLMLMMIEAPQATAEITFSDIGGNEWFAPEVMLLARRNIIDGYPDGSYRPDDPFRIDEFIKCLVMALHGQPMETQDSYWAQGYIDTADNQKWLRYLNYQVEVDNYSAPITREQMSVILYAAAADIPGVQMNGNRIHLMYKLSEYQKGVWVEPRSRIQGLYSYEMMYAVYGLGIITGYPNGVFGAYRYLTRAEAAVVLARVIDPSRRIYPDVGFDPPRNKVEEVEGILFDFNRHLIIDERDTGIDYFMCEQMQKTFATMYYASFEYHQDGTIRFYMPQLPSGFHAYSAVVVLYKEGVEGQTIDENRNRQTLYATAGNIPPLNAGEWYEYRAEYGWDMIEEILLQYVIIYSDYYKRFANGNNLAFYYNFPKSYYLIYYINTTKVEENNVSWEVQEIE